MNNIFSTKKALSALDMSRFGIETLILIEHEGIDIMMREYATKPDDIWCEGRGKKYLHKKLHKQLMNEDKYFSKNPKAIQRNAERWENFMGDCLIYATLNAFLFDEPVYLLHPESYEKLIAESPLNATSGEQPTFIEGVLELQ